MDELGKKWKETGLDMDDQDYEDEHNEDYDVRFYQ